MSEEEKVKKWAGLLEKASDASLNQKIIKNCHEVRNTLKEGGQKKVARALQVSVLTEETSLPVSFVVVFRFASDLVCVMSFESV